MSSLRTKVIVESFEIGGHFCVLLPGYPQDTLTAQRIDCGLMSNRRTHSVGALGMHSTMK